jgi:tripartite-type tricarboxylate transporter receptor subunit TctC
MQKLTVVVLALFISIVLCVGINIEVAGAQADQFPTKPIKLLIREGPGGSLDVPVRALASAAERILGQPVVCVNFPGGGGTRVLNSLLKEKADGYTLGTLAVGSIIQAHVAKLELNVPDDFTPVIKFQCHPGPIAVKKDAPWKSWQEFINFAREHKGELKIGVWGSKSMVWLNLKQIETKENVSFTYVPSASSGEAMTQILGGHIDATTGSSAVMYSKPGGDLRTLLLFADKRIESLPEVPTAKELGYKGPLMEGGYSGLLAPKGLPGPVLMRLHDAFKQAMQDSDYVKIVNKFMLSISYKNPEEYKKELKEVSEAIKDALEKIKE